MRDLLAENTIVEVRDVQGGVVHEITCRKPTTTERVQFAAGRFERRDNRIIDRTYRQQIRFGLEVITGVAKGTLAAGGRGISTDPKDPDYREDWKDLLLSGAPEIVAVVGQVIFGGVESARLPDHLQDLEVVVEEVDPADPLAG